MQLKLSWCSARFKQNGSRAKTFALSALLAVSFVAGSYSDAMAQKKSKKFPKGFVHNTAGDGTPSAPAAPTSSTSSPKWIQYDAGGLYYYNLKQYEKARQYWLEAMREAEVALPIERKATGLKPQSAAAFCSLEEHLSNFVEDVHYNPRKTKTIGMTLGLAFGQNAPRDTTQRQLDATKASIRDMERDWDWYERICSFAIRTVGKQRDCMRPIYNRRTMLEREIVNARRSAQNLELALGIPLNHSSIDVRPLKWDGVPGAGSPFDTPNSNPVPLELRGGARPESLQK